MKYLAIDIGNVICKLEFNEFLKKLKEWPGNPNTLDYVEPLECFQQIQVSMDLGITTIGRSLKSFYPELANWQLEYCRKLWLECIFPNKRMLKFVKTLSKLDVKIALLSNMGQEHHENLKLLCPELFETCINHLSFLVGARKPQNLFFQSFLMANPEFKGCYYLDDLDVNLSAGQKFGFIPIKFELDKLLKLPQVQQTKYLKELGEKILLPPVAQ